MSDVLRHFSTIEWNFMNERWNELTRKLTSEDRELFFCDVKGLVWNNYFMSYVLGIRKYILKDPIETLPQARIKWQRLYWIHQGFKLIVVCILCMITWAIVSRLLVALASS